VIETSTPLKSIWIWTWFGDECGHFCQAVEYHFGLDLIVRTPATVARRLALGDSFLHEATQNGKVLYERSGRDPHASPTMA
jgi:hypothetical protein